MPDLNFDGKEYDLDESSEDAKSTVASLRFVENRMLDLSRELAVYNAAKLAYVQSLNMELDKSNIKPFEIEEEVVEID